MMVDIKEEGLDTISDNYKELANRYMRDRLLPSSPQTLNSSEL